MDNSSHFQPHSGIWVPKMIYGTAWKKERTAELVEKALLHGFVGIDTACQPKHYNEVGVGQGLHRAINNGVQRDSLFIQTKFTPVRGQDPNTIPYDPNTAIAQQIKTSCEVSLRNLGISIIDSLVLHSPLPRFEQTMEAWTAMEQLVNMGTVRQIGISNCYDLSLFEQLFSASSIPPSVLQNRFYQKTNYDVSLRRFCKKHRIVYQSFWTLTANPSLLLSQPIVTCASKYNKSQNKFCSAT